MHCKRRKPASQYHVALQKSHTMPTSGRSGKHVKYGLFFALAFSSQVHHSPGAANVTSVTSLFAVCPSWAFPP
jgi:hypothetical protein